MKVGFYVVLPSDRSSDFKERERGRGRKEGEDKVILSGTGPRKTYLISMQNKIQIKYASL